MNTKTFAQEARKILMQGVAKKLLYWGFNEKGVVLEQPEKISGGYSFRGEVFDDPTVPNLWNSLQKAITTKSIEVVVEEAAYTWFNRIMALRILVKNGYEEPQLENATGLENTPIILQKARQGKSDFLTASEKTRLQKILTDYTKDQEAFSILITGYCHSHKTLQRVFGKIDDYTELLLPDNILQTDGFLHLLNTTDAITNEDYQKVELIGWLYQFYISEKKDDVFASFKKGKKAEAKDIPAATQIFTPNWIVKYMVENTAGKIWLDHHPTSELKNEMKYLVDTSTSLSADDQVNVSSSVSSRAQSRDLLIKNVEELTLIDPAAGSGHILVEGFDLIYKMYLEAYYTPEEAVASILKNNLYGLDIDDRAAQLATFAVLLKAAKVYPAIWSKNWMPNIYAMPEAADFSIQEINDFLGEDGADYTQELEVALRLMKQAKNLGSVMKLDINEEARTYIEESFAKLKNTEFRDFNIEAIYQKMVNYIPVLLLLTKKYTSVVANPPYMGQKNMNAKLKNYVNTNYPISKKDLYSVFINHIIDSLSFANGYIGLITPPSWLFTSSYSTLREQIVENLSIHSLLNLGRGTFGVDFGATSFVLENHSRNNYLGVYRNLFRTKVTVDSAEQKRLWFLDSSFNFYKSNQENFKKIKGTPMAFWLTKKVFKIFQENPPLDKFLTAKQGLATADNNRFRRDWYEVSIDSIGKNGYSKTKKWYPYNSGGQFRKWYGNHDYVVNWENDGKELKDNKPKSVIRSPQLYFKSSASWSKMTASGLAFRYYPDGFIFDVAGCSAFGSFENKMYVIGLLNSVLKKVLVESINQSFNYEVGQISSVPVIKDKHYDTIVRKVEKIIELSKKDWNRTEKSWNFSTFYLLNNSYSLETSFLKWVNEASEEFFICQNEEKELNQLFIKVYDLEAEINDQVELKNITLLQEELDSVALEELEATFREKGAEAIELPIKRDIVIQQFISYAIGLCMGRYRLDKNGLHIAHPNPTAAEIANYSYNNGNITIDEDAILPLMGTACNFPDDALQQIYNLLDVIWGTETRTENINFIQECLDKDLEKFLITDFYKYHCNMYKKKPIYWLFSSKKGAFQVLVYMHRMNAFTAEKIRANYLLPHIKNLNSEIELLEKKEANLNTQEVKKLEQLRKNRDECEEYETELKTVADNQITFDLDDGVSVNYKKFETVVAKIK